MRISQTILILLLIELLTIPALCQWKHLGADFSINETTPINELTEYPEKYFNKNVRIEGVIASACTNEGCFIEVVSKDGEGEGIVINFPELIYKFPTDCAGKEVIVEGMFYQKIYPKSRVSHWQGHSFRKGITVPEFSLIKRMSAKAVSIKEEKGFVPKPGKINSASVDKISLDKMEFETDGFGCGKKILVPGDRVEEHNSGNYREIIYCLEGEIIIIKNGSEKSVLSPGEITFIPPNTKHKISNNANKTASYFFSIQRKLN